MTKPYKVEGEEETLKLSAPRLDALERLYVRSYLSSLSHIEAHRVVEPSLKSHSNDNKYSKRANVQFHISSQLQTRAESISINPEKIMERLWIEATLEGKGSNQNARVAALQILGKQLGMFQEKKEDIKPIFTIVNYGNAIEKLEDKSLPSEITNTSIVSDIDIIDSINYNEEL